jgi:hypothetical protein
MVPRKRDMDMKNWHGVEKGGGGNVTWAGDRVGHGALWRWGGGKGRSSLNRSRRVYGGFAAVLCPDSFPVPLFF